MARCFHTQCPEEFDNRCQIIFRVFYPTIFYLEEKLPPSYFCCLPGVFRKIREGVVEDGSIWPSQQICHLISPLALFLLAGSVWFSRKWHLTVQMLVIFIDHDPRTHFFVQSPQNSLLVAVFIWIPLGLVPPCREKEDLGRVFCDEHLITAWQARGPCDRQKRWP